MVLPNFFTNQVDNDMNFSKQQLQPFKIIYCSLFYPLARQVFSYLKLCPSYVVILLGSITTRCSEKMSPHSDRTRETEEIEPMILYFVVIL